MGGLVGEGEVMQVQGGRVTTFVEVAITRRVERVTEISNCYLSWVDQEVAAAVVRPAMFGA